VKYLLNMDLKKSNELNNLNIELEKIKEIPFQSIIEYTNKKWGEVYENCNQNSKDEFR